MADDDEEDPAGGAENIFNTYTAGEGGPRTIVAVLPSGATEGGVDLINLPNPRTGAMARYALSRPRRDELYEVQRCRPRTGSWLLGAPDDAVIEDGSLVVLSPVDATLLALPSLESAAAEGDRFCALEDAVTRGAGGESMRAVLGVGSLLRGVAQVCETRQVGTDVFYRLSEARALAWLRGKVDAAKAVIEGDTRFRFLAASGSFSSSFKKASDIAVTPEGVTRAALGFVGEYLNQKWLSRCAGACGIGGVFEPARAARLIAPTKGVKRDASEFGAAGGFHRPSVGATSSPGPPQAKKQKQEPDRKAVAESRAETKRKKDLEKGKGSRLVTSFFTPVQKQQPKLDADDGDDDEGKEKREAEKDDK